MARDWISAKQPSQSPRPEGPVGQVERAATLDFGPSLKGYPRQKGL